MSEELRHYYEKELRFIRKEAEEFGEQYRPIAERLGLREHEALDPHVERLIQAFALLAGRVQSKLDDEFPELTEALLNILYPHYLAPVPSLAVVQFDVDPSRGELAEGVPIPAKSRLITDPVSYDPGDPAKGLACPFRTCYPLRLWPLRLAGARLQTGAFGDLTGEARPPPQTKAALRLRLECAGEATFATLKSLDRLRFYLAGDTTLVGRLYELLFNNTLEVLFRPLDGAAAPFRLRPGEHDCLLPVGFGGDEGLLSYPSRAFVGYRLLTEFFAFPNKFFFVDLAGFARARAAGFGRGLEVVLFLNQGDPALAKAVTEQTFRLGCTPVINLFEGTTALDLKPSHYEYQLVPDADHRRGVEVCSVDGVTRDDPAARKTVTYHPFYSLRHGTSREADAAFWYAARRQAMVRDDHGAEKRLSGTETYLNLVDLNFDPRLPATPRLNVAMTCMNRDAAIRRLRAKNDLEMRHLSADPLAGNPRCVTPPTLPRYPPLRRGTYWRLVSHLSLNHLSLSNIHPETGEESEGDEGRKALQEILRLYDHLTEGTGPVGTHSFVDAVLAVKSRRVVRRTGARTAGGFAQGIEVDVEIDREGCLGTGAYLFACVLERFLGLYASINSFSQLVLRTPQEKGILKTWPPRAGEQQLV